MVEKFNTLKTFVNNANTTVLLFSVLCLFYLNFVVSGNEEIYVGWAKSYFSPEWLPNSFVYDHWVSHRFVFEAFFGFLISLVGFETAVVLGRLLAAAAFAWSLARFFQQIKLTNMESLLVVVVFISLGQNLLPSEWIFMSVEPKVFAYPLIFLSLTELLKGNQKCATAYIIAATYLHVLVGGWFFIYFLFYLIWNKNTFRELAQISLLYVLGILPLLLFLAPNIFSGPSNINGMNLNWIYVFYRVPEQAPFVNGKLNLSETWELRKIITVGFYFILAWVIHKRKYDSRDIKAINDFNIIIPAFILMFLVVAYFDRTGDILKFRPFRGVSLYFFLVLTEALLLTKLYLTREKTLATFSQVSGVVLAILITYGTGRNIANKYIEPYLLKDKGDIAMEEVMSFAKNKTEKDSIFLVKGINERKYWSFSRHTNRDLFVLFKFIPIDKSKWYEWYQRVHVKVDNAEQMAALKEKYKLDYYLTIPSRPRIGEVVFENSHYIISRIKDL